jgi:hypothetical protein
MSLQIIDNNWELKIDASFDSAIKKHSLGFFNSPFVVVLIQSSVAHPLWQKAGTIGQSIVFNNEVAYGAQKNLSLNENILLEFPIFFGNSYELFYFASSWLGIVSIKVWEYAGTTQETLINNLIAALQTQIITTNLSQENQQLLNTINQKIDDMPLNFEPVINIPSTSANTATSTTVALSTTSVSLLAANTNRKKLIISNNSNQDLYIDFDATASIADHSIRIPKVTGAGFIASYELERFTGPVSGIWGAAGSGAALVREMV